ncbi:50S ribosomal protein L11, chloroplastic-like [Triticum aestivum]|uniref:50S ribosomal protein L11, chloroplastic-like n=1 Tax=Triticum aestivum TaxID=4565 RepID=UPI001D0154CE|nr:50S ribosomal protein L11, chloroplastic-like [Triticum aestivum]
MTICIKNVEDKDACGIASLQDKSFTFILKTPPASVLLLKAAVYLRLYSCSVNYMVPYLHFINSDSQASKKAQRSHSDQVRTIAQEKLPDLNCKTIKSAMRIIAGTAANMGIDVDPPILVKKRRWSN